MKDLIIAWCELMEEAEFDMSAAEGDDAAWFLKLEWVANGKPTAEGREIFREYRVHD